jgi:hypothetical protein
VVGGSGMTVGAGQRAGVSLEQPRASEGKYTAISSPTEIHELSESFRIECDTALESIAQMHLTGARHSVQPLGV